LGAGEGVVLVYLPPYCPELNPIEYCFSVIKSHFRRAGILANSGVDAEWPIKETAFNAITPELLAPLYANSSYSLPPGLMVMDLVDENF
jgi:hypothetical protein